MLPIEERASADVRNLENASRNKKKHKEIGFSKGSVREDFFAINRVNSSKSFLTEQAR